MILYVLKRSWHTNLGHEYYIMNKCFIIAEAGVNHNGSKLLAFELVEIAAKAGADAIKFQTFSADELVRKGTDKASYQKTETGGGDQHSMLKMLEMSKTMHFELIDHCKLNNIEFMSTAFDKDSLDFLLKHGMKRIKIPSGEITNHPFIRHVASKNLPIIMSTGMCTMDEVVEAQLVILKERVARGFTTRLESILTILHCTSNYPALPEDINLRAMVAIAELTGMPIGYSDHTLGLAVSTAAVAMGAVVIEKHFSKSRSLTGPDHKASLEPDELTELVKSVSIVTKALGSKHKHPTENELPIRELVRRSVTLNKDVELGSSITLDDITLKRPGTGILPKYINEIIGKKAVAHLYSGDTLNWSDIA